MKRAPAAPSTATLLRIRRTLQRSLPSFLQRTPFWDCRRPLLLETEVETDGTGRRLPAPSRLSVGPECARLNPEIRRGPRPLRKDGNQPFSELCSSRLPDPPR